MNTIQKKVPQKACMLASGADGATSFTLTEAQDNKPSRFVILGYSGGVIQNHWWWGNLVINTAGMSFPKEQYPVLLDHDTDKRIGFSKKPVIGPNGSLSIETDSILDNQYSQQFFADSKAGFPFQASIRVRPTKIKNVDSGETVNVNGFDFTGPGTVFMESTYMEVSACVFGWDSNTSSAAFAEDITADFFVKEQTMSKMDEWKKEDPKGFESFCEGIRKEATEAFQQVLADKEATIASLSKTAEAAKAEKEAVETRLSKLERDIAVQTEASRRAEFERSVADASASLPEHMRGKFAKMFRMDEFRLEDGALDTAKLSTALAAEKQEWETAFAEVTPSVIGGGRQPEQTGEFGMSDDEYKKLAEACGLSLTE